MKWLVCAILFVTLSQNCIAQLRHISIGLERGLPSRSVYGICQDTDGRIWLGTDNGVAYLQGGVIKKLEHPGLPKVVQRVFAAPDSGVFIVGNNPSGIYKVYSNGESVALPSADSLRFTGLLIAFSASEKAIYYSNWQYLFKSTLDRCDTLCKLKGSELNSIESSSIFPVFINTKSGLYTWKNDTLRQVHSQPSETTCELGNGISRSISASTIHDYSSNEKGTKTTKVNWQILPRHAAWDGTKAWFTGHGQGLYCLQSDSLYCLSDELLLPHTDFTYIFADSDQNLWCGTNGKGIVLLPHHENFTNIHASTGLTDNFIAAIIATPYNRVLVATKTGLHEVFNKTVSHIKPADKYDLWINPATINSVIYSSNDKIIGTVDQGLKAKYALNSQYGYSVHTSASFLLDSFVVYGGWGNLKVADADKIDKQPVQNLNTSSLKFGRITGFAKVHEGLLISADGGMFLLDNSFELHQMNCPDEPTGYFVGVVNINGNWWASSTSALYSWSGGIWTPFSLEVGAMHTTITDIEADPFERLWLATEQGLICVEDSFMTSISEVNGLVANDINLLEYNPDDTSLWIGTEYGLSILDIQETNLGKTFNYRPSIESLISNGQSFSTRGQFELSSSQNSFSINTALTNYFGFAKPEYRYKLKGTGSNWQLTDKTEIDFLALSPGAYNLIIQARAPGYRWGQTTEMQFIIKRPFYERWEFYLFSLILIIGLTFLIYQLRIRSIKKAEEEKRNIQTRINELELQALNANMNPHFIFNSLNSVQHFLMPLKNFKALQFIDNLSKLIRINMLAVGKRLVHLEGEIERLDLYVSLEKVRFEKELTFEKHLNLISDSKTIWIPSMLIQPAVENAIWHGIMPSDLAGRIVVSISENDGFLHIEVTDNGIGLTAAKANKIKGHQSKGSTLVEERLKLHDKRNHFAINEILAPDTNKVLGTKVTIRVKMTTTG